MNIKLRKAIHVATEETVRQGKHLVVALLDDSKESLEIVTTYPKVEQRASLAMLDAILQTALNDTEENDGEGTETTSLIH